MRARSFLSVAIVAAAVAPGAPGQPPPTPPPAPVPLTVTVSLDRKLATFEPARAIGAGVDGHSQGDTASIYTPANLRAMRSAGLGALSYRLRTELGVEAWHWNPRGSWSDPARRQGYWTGSAQPSGRVQATYGYRLPRRGNTIDQANDDGYSRLDDGNAATFWKSNPYLDPHYTHEPEARHRQWVIMDLGRDVPVEAIGLDWAAPYARRVHVSYWLGENPFALIDHPPSAWRDFQHADFAGAGGTQVMRVADAPQTVRFVRVELSDSSHSAPAGSRDVRDRLGFAIREVHAGLLAAGRVADVLRHVANRTLQSVIYTSSTDPWHRASDIDTGTEQPSLQQVLASGLGGGQPILAPVPALYGTPADAAAELRYMRALRFPVRRLEIGEEPDGQLVTPEDYGALYREVARAVRRVDPGIGLGGPGYQTSIPDWVTWPDARGERSWTKRFVAELRRTGVLRRALNFFSFEWYPFDNGCAPAARQLARASDLLALTLRRQRLDGLPARVPAVITEYGYSAFATERMVDLPGALLNADIVGRFLSLGGETAYLYGYEPDSLMRELSGCNSWGNLVLLLADDNRNIRQPVATYWVARMLTGLWTEGGFRRHTLVATASSAPGAPVSTYAVRRPDGRLALLVVNKDPSHAYRIRIVLRGGRGGGRFDAFTLSHRQYMWHPHDAHGYARPDLPPAHTTLTSGVATLAPYSVTVLRTAAPLR